MERPTQEMEIYQYKSAHWKVSETEIVVEKPVSLSVNGKVWLSFMCTPQDLQALMVGFLYNEQVIQSVAEIASLHICADGNNVDIWLNHNVEEQPIWRRTSGCAGGFTNAPVETPLTIDPSGVAISPSAVNILIQKLFESQTLYRQSGGVHTSALSDGSMILAHAEDIGRHNTFDKIAGICLLKGIETKDCILLTTGRVSSEMLQKAARMGIPILVSRTSPTTLSVDLARRMGITLIGYARRDGFNLYTHPERVIRDAHTGITPIYYPSPSRNGQSFENDRSKR